MRPIKAKSEARRPDELTPCGVPWPEFNILLSNFLLLSIYFSFRLIKSDDDDDDDDDGNNNNTSNNNNDDDNNNNNKV